MKTSPEGTEVDFVRTDEGGGPVDLLEEELAELETRIAESNKGNLVAASAVFAELRARR